MINKSGDNFREFSQGKTKQTVSTEITNKTPLNDSQKNNLRRFAELKANTQRLNSSLENLENNGFEVDIKFRMELYDICNKNIATQESSKPINQSRNNSQTEEEELKSTAKAIIEKAKSMKEALDYVSTNTDPKHKNPFLRKQSMLKVLVKSGMEDKLAKIEQKNPYLIKKEDLKEHYLRKLALMGIKSDKELRRRLIEMNAILPTAFGYPEQTLNIENNTTKIQEIVNKVLSQLHKIKNNLPTVLGYPKKPNQEASSTELAHSIEGDAIPEEATPRIENDIASIQEIAKNPKQYYKSIDTAKRLQEAMEEFGEPEAGEKHA